MDDSERYDSTEAAGRPDDGPGGAGAASGTPDGRPAEGGAPGPAGAASPTAPSLPTSPFGATAPGWNGPAAGAFDGFAAGAPGAPRLPRRRTAADTPTPGGQYPAGDQFGLDAGAGVMARLAGADGFDAFGTGAKVAPRHALPADDGAASSSGSSGSSGSDASISGAPIPGTPIPDSSIPGAAAGEAQGRGAGTDFGGIASYLAGSTSGFGAAASDISTAAAPFGGGTAGERDREGDRDRDGDGTAVADRDPDGTAVAPRHGRHVADAPERAAEAPDALPFREVPAPAPAPDQPSAGGGLADPLGTAPSAPDAPAVAAVPVPGGYDPAEPAVFGVASPVAGDATASGSGASPERGLVPFLGDSRDGRSGEVARPAQDGPADGRSDVTSDALPGKEVDGVPTRPSGFDAFGASLSAPGAAGAGATGAPGAGSAGPSGAGPGQELVPFFGGGQDAGRAVAPADGAGRAAGTPGGFDAFGTGSAPSAPAGGSFDAFAAGALRPVEDNPALPAVRPVHVPSLFDGSTPAPRTSRPAREPLALEPARGSGNRIEQVATGTYLLTVNPVDGTEVTTCPPEEHGTSVRRTREDRAARAGSARPAPPPGQLAPELPLLEREEERERLVRLLGRGRSVRVTGPCGAGRTALLESVANACERLAPDGVLWLSGYRRTLADVLQDLWALVHTRDGYRPTREELPGLLREVGAVVVVDDLEFGGTAVEELLAAAPECAFLMAATPDVPAPTADALVEELFLSGLTRTACADLLQLATGRPLEEDEAAWAADLWFESEGLPLRFVQAAALLRQRDALRQPSEPDPDDSVWQKGAPALPAPPDLTPFDGPVAALEPTAVPRARESRPRLPASAVPLPSLAESAAPAELLASRLGEAAREALAFAVALDGQFPHPSHLPALVGDTHGDAAIGELTSVGLAVPVGANFRLAAGVAAQLAGSFGAEGELTDVQAHTAALHYAWWTGHPSVTPERAAAECETIIAALTACRDGGHASAAVLLARTVAPAFAAALHWGAWERALRIGQEAARLSGEVAEEAYFLHELGVLALCTGHPERARAELEASIALRAALADRKGTVVGRRTLALVEDAASQADTRTVPRIPAPIVLTPSVDGYPAGFAEAFPDELPDGYHQGVPAVPRADGPASATAPLPAVAPVVIAEQGLPVDLTSGPGPRRPGGAGSKRALVAAGTGVLLAAVLGTIVTLGAHSGDDTPDNQVKPIESVQQDQPADGSTSPATADAPATAPSSTSSSPSASDTASASSTASETPSGTASPSASDTPSGTTSTSASADPTATRTKAGSTPPKSPSSSPQPTHTTVTTQPTTTAPTTVPTTEPPTTPPDSSGGDSSSVATATNVTAATAQQSGTAAADAS
ncbi:hypothetical protein [Actinacidiphila yeochonensis]|uniref:hypothetical protein n=1 Tax=Actinacidiphila yeochonensis TaxID=89050 RepID=UPI000D1BFAE3|nr:hypothetical protein [Actinacidiphila yeochonensis]